MIRKFLSLAARPSELRHQPWLRTATIICWVVYIPWQINIMRVLGPSADKVLALQLATGPAKVTEVLNQWTEADRSAFFAHLPLDLVHALWWPFGLAFSWAMLFRFARLSERIDRLIWVGFAGAALDHLENVLDLYLVMQHPVAPLWAALLAFSASSLKWCVVVLGFGSMPVLFAIGLWKRRA